jgi:predicted CXXCH cytochrome family protein
MPQPLGLILALAAQNIVLRPLPQSVVPAGPVSVIAKGAGDLRIDGKPVKAAQPAPGVVTAELKLTPGRHVLTFGTAKVEFGVGAPVDSWKPFRAHPPASDCGACHTAPDWEFKGHDACLNCHDRQAFAKLHTHNAEVLAECHLCHLPHGSTEARHLKMTKETACKQCHG